MPIVFVHGFSGSGAQYETRALRWASNGYPSVVTAIDRTSSSPAVIYPILDDYFDDLMAQTGAPQICVVGHSLGTAIMAGYLASSPARAARVAKYLRVLHRPRADDDPADRLPAVVGHRDQRRRRRREHRASEGVVGRQPARARRPAPDRDQQHALGRAGPFDIVNQATTPFVGNTIAIITFDDGSDRVSHPDQLIPGLGAFLTGIDVWYPATAPIDGTVSFVHDQRNFTRQQVINTPNWASSTDFMTVTYRDGVQDLETWPQCVRAKPSPCQ